MSHRDAKTAQSRIIPSRFDVEPKRIGCPRLDHYDRLISRFYEPLVLLNLLGKSRGDHKPRPQNQNSAQSTRRRFLGNLSYICDFEKGGNTSTAIGLEETETRYRFWVASNKGTAEITHFLRDTLRYLRDTHSYSEMALPPNRKHFVRMCVDFARRRIVKEKKCLSTAIEKCLQNLVHSNSTEAERLSEWLKLLLSHDDNLTLCSFAYENRHSEFVAQLQVCSGKQEHLSGIERGLGPFALARHFLGRLAQHIRAPEELFEAAIDVSHILQTFDVCAVNYTVSVPAPEPDGHTNLYGVVNRMLPKNSNERLDLERGLSDFNTVRGIYKDFLKEYQGIKPRVHAEVQILEYFYWNRMRFAENDRYVACSKPACLCCEMYFEYHPARMVVPESHQNVWTNWGPPLVQNFSKLIPAGRLQLDLLNKMIRKIRSFVINQALGNSVVGHRHPDSVTGITEIHCFSDISTTGTLQQESPLITCKAHSLDEKIAKARNVSVEGSLGVETLGCADEECDLESGGVAIYA